MAKYEDFLKQAERLGYLKFVPDDPGYFVEITKILERRCRNAEHAGRVIERFLMPGAPVERPTPGEVAQMCKDVPANPALDRPDLADPCEHCEVYGGYWQMGPHGLTRCNCARGQKLKAMDMEREKRPEKKQPGKLAPARDYAQRASGDSE